MAKSLILSNNKYIRYDVYPSLLIDEMEFDKFFNEEQFFEGIEYIMIEGNFDSRLWDKVFKRIKTVKKLIYQFNILSFNNGEIMPIYIGCDVANLEICYHKIIYALSETIEPPPIYISGRINNLNIRSTSLIFRLYYTGIQDGFYLDSLKIFKPHYIEGIKCIDRLYIMVFSNNELEYDYSREIIQRYSLSSWKCFINIFNVMDNTYVDYIYENLVSYLSDNIRELHLCSRVVFSNKFQLNRCYLPRDCSKLSITTEHNYYDEIMSFESYMLYDNKSLRHLDIEIDICSKNIIYRSLDYFPSQLVHLSVNNVNKLIASVLPNTLEILEAKNVYGPIVYWGGNIRVMYVYKELSKVYNFPITLELYVGSKINDRVQSLLKARRVQIKKLI